MPLAEADIKVGNTYRAKRHVEILTKNNDRYVVWISPDRSKVQYDSDTVRLGRHYPTTTMKAFLNWVKSDVTEEYKKEEA